MQLHPRRAQDTESTAGVKVKRWGALAARSPALLRTPRGALAARSLALLRTPRGAPAARPSVFRRLALKVRVRGECLQQ